MGFSRQRLPAFLDLDASSWPVLICLLGNFRLLQGDHRLAIANGGKGEALLCYLGLHAGRRVARDELVALLWPNTEPTLARRSLNNLVYSLHKHFEEPLGGIQAVVHEDGYYRLHTEAGVGVDIACFDALIRAAEQHARGGDRATAALYYGRAARLYRGDLCVASDLHAVVERERLRNCYLILLAELADYHYQAGDYTAALDYAWRLLAEDPCREDAHRQVMRCYVRRGLRAAALRHYHLCAAVLQAEFGAIPEAATTELFDQIRLQPDGI